jgi:hypothetical protein
MIRLEKALRRFAVQESDTTMLMDNFLPVQNQLKYIATPGTGG